MSNSGDAAEQVIRLSLETCEVAAKLTGSAAKDIAKLLMTVLKQEISQSGKIRGKARLTNMLKSGKELKVFALRQKDLEKFTQHAKQYGVLYCVLRDKANSNPNAMVDVIARAEDASKIQRIFDRFSLGNVDKASVVTEAEQSRADRKSAQLEHKRKTKGEILTDEALGKPIQKEKNSMTNPMAAKTEKGPLSELNSETADMHADKGVARPIKKKPSVRAKLNQLKAEAVKQKKSERIESVADKTTPNRQIKHNKQKRNKSKER